MHRFNLRRQSFVSIEVWWIVMHTYGNIAPQWGVLLSPFLIVKLHLMFLFMIIFLTYVRIRRYFFNTFLWCRVHEIETYCTIFRRLRLRTSHWRPLQFFFFTPSLLMEIHFIHISDESWALPRMVKGFRHLKYLNSCWRFLFVTWLSRIISKCFYTSIKINIIFSYPSTNVYKKENNKIEIFRASLLKYILYI